MILQRDTFEEWGIFGTLRTDDDIEICKTLEHAYKKESGGFFAKVPVGRFICTRGVHQLAGGQPFETFEIGPVYGHSGLLFHVGNYNENSHGCVLLGQQISHRMLVRSVSAFNRFMEMLHGVETFSLVVV